MAFLLYRIDRAAGCYRLVKELKAANSCSLWGGGGAVARVARPQVPSDEGPWRVTEAELVADLLQQISGLEGAAANDFAILDDLVPGETQRRVARILKIDGLGLYNEYNPFLLTMSEVLNVDPPDVLPGLDPIPLERSDASLIRTVNYLVYGWQPPRSFSGALLWPEAWNHLKQCC